MRHWLQWQYTLLYIVCTSGILLLIRGLPAFSFLVVCGLVVLHGTVNYIEGYYKAERQLTIDAVIKSVEKYTEKEDES